MDRLSLTHISKSFGTTKVLNDINITFEGGSVHALLGQNGAGKSTLMKILSGAHQADSGTIKLNEHSYTPPQP